MAGDRLFQHINVSGNARVHFGDNFNNGQRADASASRAEALLEWLHYPRMASRKESVKDTHADTFQWILRPENSGDRANPGFRAWLEHGSGIYWIAGKAESGKSTLMKLITEHDETLRALEIWAGNKSWSARLSTSGTAALKHKDLSSACYARYCISYYLPTKL
jgi:hypothetical protein